MEFFAIDLQIRGDFQQDARESTQFQSLVSRDGHVVFQAAQIRG
jgi:hypothetical protein